jgi:dihydrofolate reductase
MVDLLLPLPEWFSDVFAAGGAELVAYTEFREHIKDCVLCMLDKHCLAGNRLFEEWQQKQLKSMKATLEATGDFVGGDT